MCHVLAGSDVRLLQCKPNSDLKASYRVHKLHMNSSKHWSVDQVFMSICQIASTVEPHYNKVLGTMKITLLYQVSHYIRVKKQRNIKSWDQQNNLVIRWFMLYQIASTVEPHYNKVLGTMKFTLLYQVSHYIRVKKLRNIKSWDQHLVIRGFCYIRPLYRNNANVTLEEKGETLKEMRSRWRE